LTAQRSNSNTVWFNFQMHIYIYTVKSVLRDHIWDKGKVAL
jgi:hypothetical protein